MGAKPAILHDNRFADGAPVASDTAAGNFDVANLTDWLSFTWWKPASMPATATVDAGAAKSVNYWAVWGHDLGSQGATIELRKSNDNFAVNDVLVDSYTPPDDEPFARYVTTADEQSWRIRVTGASAPSLAIVAAGSLFEFPEYLEQDFDPVGREPHGRFNRSVKGQALGRETDFEAWSQQLYFRRVTRSWVRNSFLPAWQAHLRGSPFIFAWDRTTYPDEIRLASVDGGFETPHKSGTKADLSFEIGGEA